VKRKQRLTLLLVLNSQDYSQKERNLICSRLHLSQKQILMMK
jgi:hypothetical protein